MIVKKIDYLFDIIFSALLFSLPISAAIPNILLGLLLLVFLIKKDKVVVFNKYIKLVLIYISYLFIKAVVFNSFVDNFFLYKHLLVVLGLSFLIFNIKDINLIIKGYILGVFLAVSVSVYKIVNFYFIFKTLPFGNTSEVQELILIHRPYFGFMCLMAIILTSVLLPRLKLKNEKKVYILFAFLIAVFLYVIVARLALFLLIIYLVAKAINYFKLSKRNSVLGGVAILVVVAVFLTMNKNLKDRLHIKSSYANTLKVIENQEPRFVIWDCFFNQIIHPEFNIYFGYSNRKFIQEELNNCYNTTIENVSKKDYYVETKFNTHNQFFDIFLEGGIVGLTLMLSILFFSLYTFKDSFNSIFVICSFVLFLMVENLFHRQLGVYLFGVFIPLFHKITKEKK
ncbi:O-antigen ligase family protein [Polaribacter sp. Z014]|uniref:O-antigen ligase family protein n=1 Tax=Polaribacter sp. Z014 TaxID=2927126 RepID=UPI002021195B|nr:O-antigen ligase family protein [Polaribacter sp. Z014]MCL7761848.1 O-antigen ligase family protein [Polaribacter sp. Z014]